MSKSEIPESVRDLINSMIESDRSNSGKLDHESFKKLDKPDSPEVKTFVTIEYGNDHETAGCMGNGIGMRLHDAFLYSTSLALKKDSRRPKNLHSYDLKIVVQILGDGFKIFDCKSSSIKDFAKLITPDDYQKLGIIVELKNGNSATYLPGVSNVFSSMEEVLITLVQKANRSHFEQDIEQIASVLFYSTVREEILIPTKEE